MRLKSRDKWVPGGFQMIHPEVGQKKPWSGSFTEIVRMELDFRTRNPLLVEKNGWSLDPDTVAADVEQYNAQRMVAAGYFNFVDLEGQPEPSASSNQRRPGGGLAAVADGARLIVEWLGSGQRPVPIEIAEKRASICVACPLNSGGDWKHYFTAPVANQVRHLLGVKHDMDLKTSLDDKLTVCAGCDCELKLKVWTPLKHALAYLSDETKKGLHPSCWLLTKDGAVS